MKPTVMTINDRSKPHLSVSWFTLVTILLTVLTIFFYVTFHVQANGKTGNILEVTEGAYRIELRSYPTEIREGNMHFSMVFNHTEDESPADNLSVEVMLFGPPPNVDDSGKINILIHDIFDNFEYYWKIKI